MILHQASTTDEPLMTGKTGNAEIAEFEQAQARDSAGDYEGPAHRREAARAVVASFFAMFCVVGIALWGLSFYYDFMVQQFGWTRAQVTSGNALAKLLIGPVFGFIAGWVVDRFGPRRLLIAGILMAGVAVVGLGSVSTLPWFYFFYSRWHSCVGDRFQHRCWCLVGSSSRVEKPWGSRILG